MKKNVAVVLGTTKNSAFAIANVIIGLERHSPRLVDTYFVYHDGLAEVDRLALARLAPNVELVLYTEDYFLERSGVAGLDTTSLKRYTHMSFCRYEMFELLDRYQYAIWIDFDILVQKDISSIFDYSPVGMLPAATPIQKALGALPADCDPSLKCLSSGVIVASDKLSDYSSLTDELYFETRKYSDTATLPDQAIINYVLNRKNIDVKELPDTFGCPPEWIKARSSELIHTPGSARRLWNENSIYHAFPEWRVNNEIWETNGGTGYQGKTYNCYNCPEDLIGGKFVQQVRRFNVTNKLTSGFAKKYELLIDMDIWSDKISFVKKLGFDQEIKFVIRTADKTRCEITVEFDAACVEVLSRNSWFIELNKKHELKDSKEHKKAISYKFADEKVVDSITPWLDCLG